MMLQSRFPKKVMVSCGIRGHFILADVYFFYFYDPRIEILLIQNCLHLKHPFNFCSYFHMNSQGCQTLKFKLK